jgi:hypothetical protein
MVQPHQRWDPPPSWPGEAGPRALPGSVGAVQETGGQQIPERPVVPAGVEVPRNHLRPVGAYQRRPDGGQFLLPPPHIAAHRGLRMDPDHRHQAAIYRLD